MKKWKMRRWNDSEDTRRLALIPLKDPKIGSLDWIRFDMNSGCRTRWIEESHEGCGRAFDIPDFRWCLIWLTSPPKEESRTVA
ncbi:hypothetical protein F2Q69_00059438 [Brassica cretica]|uniref:Uncharacterized protein n=1 Tax=Brassica cretica TaxID=69181 RepID=A0A8S9RDS8_BRACR|nr:hypothetical protein F2Q69_00059438 [Brassica cretica]